MKTGRIAATLLLNLQLLFGGTALAGDAPSDVERLAADNTRFALELYSRLAVDEGNVLFSPYSISTVLAMTYAGARGETAAQMAGTLHFTLEDEQLHAAFAEAEARLRKAERPGVQLHVANSLWPQEGYPFLDAYMNLVKEHYGVTITPLNYKASLGAARATINRWVEKKTHDKIKDLLLPPDLSPLTRLVLVNAIYFKARWQTQFKPGDTRDAPFHITPERAVQTSMMSGKPPCRYGSFPTCDVLDLPYAGGGISMTILLPKEVDGIRKLEAELSADAIDRWLRELRHQDVLVFLPRFKTTCRFQLNDTLVEMGMRDAFDIVRANFAGMDGRPDNLYISAAIHKAFMEVNEEGTEAAAATAVVMTERAMPARPPTFRADHPFVFLIREIRTGSILFAGRISDPNLAGN